MTEYMGDPRAKTAEGFIAGLAIFVRHWPDGEKQSYFCGAEHDTLYFYDSEGIAEDSEDGQILKGLGFHHHGDGWAYFT